MQKVYINVGGHRGEVALEFKRENPSWRVVAFECDPRNEVEAEGVEFVWAAAWTHDGVVRFYPGLTNAGSVYGEKVTGMVNRNVSHDVPCVDFARYLRENFKREDYIHIRMNCEGAEYEIIEHLEREGMIDWVDRWDVLWHWGKVCLPRERHQRCVEIIGK